MLFTFHQIVTGSVGVLHISMSQKKKLINLHIIYKIQKHVYKLTEFTITHRNISNLNFLFTGNA